MNNMLKSGVPAFRRVILPTLALAVIALLTTGCPPPGGETPGGDQQEQVATPQLNPSTGTYSTDQSVTITDATPEATSCYTTDDSAPNNSSPVYSAPIAVTGNGNVMTIKAYAWKSGMGDSAVASATYTINYNQVSTPQFSPSPGTYTSDQAVTITDATSGATIYYTTDGSAPNNSSPVYSAPIAV